MTIVEIGYALILGSVGLAATSEEKLMDSRGETEIDNTITTLLKGLDRKVDHTHHPEIAAEVEDSYFMVLGGPVVGYEPRWTNFPELGKAPSSGRRSPISAIQRTDRISVRDMRPPVFDVSEVEMPLLDYYEITSSTFFISDQLRSLIESIDPNSLDCVQAEFLGFVPEQPYWLCMPVRALEAVDVNRTVTEISYEQFGERKFRRIHFPEGVIFDRNITCGASVFADIDNSYWFWSRELIDRVREAEIKGMTFARAGDPMTRRIEID